MIGPKGDLLGQAVSLCQDNVRHARKPGSGTYRGREGTVACPQQRIYDQSWKGGHPKASHDQVNQPHFCSAESP